MNIINGELQLGITYTLTPSVYLTSPSMVFPSHFVPQNCPSEREINLETFFRDLQQRYELLMQEHEELKNKMEEMRLNAIESQNKAQNASGRRKFIRRKEDELDKRYKCCFDRCKKQYASMLALNLHIKNKHQGGTQKQMEELARRIIQAELKGQDAPIEDMRLPEGFLEQFRRQMMMGQSSTGDLCSLSQ